MYTHNEVENATLKYFNRNELATSVWMNKYALRDENNNFLELTPRDMHKRLAKEFARIEKKYPPIKHDDLSEYGKTRDVLDEEKIFNLLDDFKQIIPQGSVMSVLGNEIYTGSLSNCVVVPSPLDSYSGICYTDQQLAQLFMRRCGVGLDITNLRPRNFPVSNVAKTSSGAVSFMERFSNTTREVSQNSRRGALIITIDCRHPDIEEFIEIKKDKTKVTGANISIQWTNDFLEAVERDEHYTLHWPVGSDNPKFTKIVKAKEIWDKMISAAWESGEPGIIFQDRMKNYTTCDKYNGFNYITTNPCSEIGMSNDSCRLITVNSFHAVDKPYTKDATFNYKIWYETIYEAQRLLDDLVDLELESVKKILQKIENDPEPDYMKIVAKQTWENLYKSGKNGRRTGLGDTALADTLAALNIKYDEGYNVVEKIKKVKMLAEFDSSIDMAIERGIFPAYNVEIDIKNGFIQMLANEFPELYQRMKKHGRRNISISTNAPNGSTSLLAKLITRYGTSSGIEPVYALEFTRRKKINDDTKPDFIDVLGDKWEHFSVFHNGYQEWLDINKDEDCPYFGSTAPEIDWIKRVELQSIMQKYITHSISSTVNLPENATLRDIHQIYMTAWKKGLKGITVYRDGSRSGVLVKNANVQKIVKNNAPKRPENLPCKINNTVVKGEQWVVLVGFLEGDPYEVFAFRNGKIKYKEGITRKLGGGKYDLICNDKVVIKDIASTYMTDEEEALTRAISWGLRHGGGENHAVEVLNKTKGSVVSFSKAIMRTLRKYAKEEEIRIKEKCPDCGGKLVYESGCKSCSVCGWSGCG